MSDAPASKHLLKVLEQTQKDLLVALANEQVEEDSGLFLNPEYTHELQEGFGNSALPPGVNDEQLRSQAVRGPDQWDLSGITYGPYNCNACGSKDNLELDNVVPLYLGGGKEKQV